MPKTPRTGLILPQRCKKIHHEEHEGHEEDRSFGKCAAKSPTSLQVDSMSAGRSITNPFLRALRVLRGNCFLCNWRVYFFPVRGHPTRSANEACSPRSTSHGLWPQSKKEPRITPMARMKRSVSTFYPCHQCYLWSNSSALQPGVTSDRRSIFSKFALPGRYISTHR